MSVRTIMEAYAANPTSPAPEGTYPDVRDNPETTEAYFAWADGGIQHYNDALKAIDPEEIENSDVTDLGDDDAYFLAAILRGVPDEYLVVVTAVDILNNIQYGEV